jgi:uncharacterized protein (TIGR02246 family)
MRHWIVAAFVLVVGTICIVTASDQPKFSGNSLVEPPGPKAAQPRSRNESGADTHRTMPPKLSPQEAVVRHAADALIAAHKKSDAKTFAAIFTPDGEYIDTHGAVFHGRKAIADEFTAFFRDTPGSTMEIEILSTRSIARNLITADCTTRFRLSDEAIVIPGKCRLVCARESDVWLIASLHESDAEIETSSHHAQVSQLEWLVGEWIGEGRTSHVHFSCHWDESGHYLLRDFTVEVAGAKPLSGTQRIGYDPITQRLKMWVFDSAGGYSDGYFNRDAETWVLRTSGVTSDGHVASTTSVYTQIDKFRMTSETTDRFVSGERIPDAEKLTLVRKPLRTLESAAQNQMRKN